MANSTDILLAHGYFLAEDENEKGIMRPYPPLGLLYVSSHLKAKGFAVEVFDATLSTPEAWLIRLRHLRPPVVGLYVNLLTRARVLAMIRQAKAIGAHVVLGGPEPANHAREYLLRGADAVVVGEGERTLEALLPHLARHGNTRLETIEGLVFLADDQRLVETPARPQIEDLDAQPYPDREAIDMASYVDLWRQHHGRGSVSLITARGCPYRCTWCSHAVFGYTHRRRSPENVVAEVEQIVARWAPDMLWYADDVFTIHHRWLDRYAALLRTRGLHLPFETISREDRLNEAVIRTLASMGCYRIWIGAESGSQRILDRMQRRTDAARVVEMVQLLKRHGIEAGMFIMLGYDGEELADLEETAERLKAALPDVFLTTVAYPIKGTAFYQQVKDRVLALRANWEQGGDRLQTLAGRRSARFYRHATRWLVSEVELHRQRTAGSARSLRRLRTWLSNRHGRAGMWLTRNEREPEPAASKGAVSASGRSGSGDKRTLNPEP